MLDWTEITRSSYQIYPEESHGLFGVTRHLYETMEVFLDEIYGPIEDYFEDDYYLAAAKLLEVTRTFTQTFSKLRTLNFQEYGELGDNFEAR